MKKLIRYQSFKALKDDVKPRNNKSLKSKDRQLQMENFVKLLRHKWIEEKKLQKKNLETFNHHE